MQLNTKFAIRPNGKHVNRINAKLAVLAVLLVVCVVFFSFIGLNSNNWEYALGRRTPRLLAIILTGSAIAFSSMIFQTIANNRILTPSILGLDSLYVFIHTTLVFLFGSTAVALAGKKMIFVLSVGVMVLFALTLFNGLFRFIGNNIFFVLLVGMIVGTFFQSLASFMQLLIDPNEFLVVQSSMFASFNNMDTNILWLAFAGMILSFGYSYRYWRTLDVLSLGRDNAINLGVEYDKVVRDMLIIIAVQVSIATALVGPITFLGLLVANLARQFLDTYKHKILITGSMLISCVALVGGQLIAARVLHFSTPISVIINFIGGLYFIYLLLKEARL